MGNCFDDCNSCICKLLSGLDVGTTIRFAIDNTDEFFELEDFTFLCFEHKNCCVTLQRPQEDTIVVVDCTKIAGVKIFQD
ncbi:hypothetical protein [Alkalihalobacillus sp. AL-G]|uniref:hypothetical protein n=1 Tax=Alkalihalobacillus sp. AL-G TaxID=2926399 RepID=UPI00272A3303|nr:hypothetical protein [Alkalihalobacillus sp. AL-G]WLD94974.1 hypothetical protein MOJ78_08870 [Alkalihalobacillus sp. AL-G]